MELERHSICELVDKLYQLAKFNGGSFKLKNGTVKRVFIDEKYDEAVIEYSYGGGDYAIDAGGLPIFTAIKNFESEYPEDYKRFMEVYEPHDEDEEVTITAENADKFMKLLEKIKNTKPS